MIPFMTIQQLNARLSNEGRIVIPAEIRRLMHAEPGDIIHFKWDTETSRIEIFTAQQIVEMVWENNKSVEPADSAQLVRSGRDEDQSIAMESEKRMAAPAVESTDNPDAMVKLLSALDLA